MHHENPRMRIGRSVYLLLLGAFLLSIAFQFFLAGLAVFATAAHWADHVMFVHLFGLYLPLLLLLFAWIGAMPGWVYAHVAGMLALIFAMYFTANIPVPWVGALHPIVAVLLAALTARNAVRVCRWRFARKQPLPHKEAR